MSDLLLKNVLKWTFNSLVSILPQVHYKMLLPGSRGVGPVVRVLAVNFEALSSNPADALKLFRFRIIKKLFRLKILM